MDRIAIIGLGLIGGSLGLALGAAQRRDLQIVGFDTDPAVRRRARERGAVAETADDAGSAVQGAGLIIVATPPTTIDEVFQTIARALAPGAAVTDVASTKEEVMEWAAQRLPASVSFVGGHPMAGKTAQGIENADAALFRDLPYAVVPGAAAKEAAIDSVVGMVRTVGARERFMTAAEHDRLVAAVSHLPLAASTALFTLLRRSDGWADFAALAGPAYRDLTRLASGDPRMASGIAVTNRPQLQYWIDRYILELQRFRELVAGPEEKIFDECAQAQRQRDQFLASEGSDGPPPGGALLPVPSPSLASLLLGQRLADRLRALTKRGGARAAPTAAAADTEARR